MSTGQRLRVVFAVSSDEERSQYEESIVEQAASAENAATMRICGGLSSPTVCSYPTACKVLWSKSAMPDASPESSPERHRPSLVAEVALTRPSACSSSSGTESSAASPKRSLLRSSLLSASRLLRIRKGRFKTWSHNKRGGSAGASADKGDGKVTAEKSDGKVAADGAEDEVDGGKRHSVSFSVPSVSI